MPVMSRPESSSSSLARLSSDISNVVLFIILGCFKFTGGNHQHPPGRLTVAILHQDTHHQPWAKSVIVLDSHSFLCFFFFNAFWSSWLLVWSRQTRATERRHVFDPERAPHQFGWGWRGEHVLLIDSRPLCPFAGQELTTLNHLVSTQGRLVRFIATADMTGPLCQ